MVKKSPSKEDQHKKVHLKEKHVFLFFAITLSTEMCYCKGEKKFVTPLQKKCLYFMFGEFVIKIRGKITFDH